MQPHGITAQLLWNDVTNALRNEFSETVYKNYIHHSVGIDIVEGTNLLVSVQNSLVKARFEQQYEAWVTELLSRLAPDIKKVLYIPREDENDNNPAPLPEIKASPSSQLSVNAEQKSNHFSQKSIPLNPHYTFDRFVIGNSNRLAYSAASAVSDKPGHVYNPLFLYSPVGLGKTHLMHAIGHKIIQDHPGLKVLYISSETFVNEMVESIQKRKTDDFRNKYRSIDVLLIDDIQFLSKKMQTQEEFFHTFNALKELNKQIVISSDCPPREIALLEDRIRSRFESGLVADISIPDLETRIAILRNKAEVESIDVPHDIIVYIADNISNNIRELEGALTRLLAVTSMTGEKLSLTLAERALKDIIKSPRQRMVTVEVIKNIVCAEFKVKLSDLESSKRPRNIAHPRQVAMYLCRELTNESLPAIGSYFNRDHSTVIHAHEKITNECKQDRLLAETLHTLVNKINNN